MKKKLITGLSVVAVIAGTTIWGMSSALSNDKLPGGWFKAGDQPKEYEIGIDKKTGYKGSSSFIGFIGKQPHGFGTLMQSFKATKYLGKRLRFSAYVKTQDITGWTGLWMRIDGPGNKPLGFDNMENRAIKGTTNWKKYDVVLDVPNNSEYIAFGILTSGKGKAWLDEVHFEVVDKSVKTTDLNDNTDEPGNLNFEN